jgi:hypothetical protein
MGLGIGFSREAAVKAGLVIFEDREGTDESIAQAMAEEHANADYIRYLSEVREYIQVPNAFHSVSNDGVGSIVVRANKWGNTYYPLTRWLTEHGIEWTEF